MLKEEFHFFIARQRASLGVLFIKLSATLYTIGNGRGET
jgi:hypothetical protein